MDFKIYIKDYWNELWYSNNKVWQIVERILFVLLPILSVFLPIVASFAWIIPLSLWVIFLSTVPFRLAYRYKKQLKQRIDDENSYKVEVLPTTGKRRATYERTQYLMWADLQVKNNSLTELTNVQVNIKQCLNITKKQDMPNEYILYNHQRIQPFVVYWSERQAQPNQIDMSIPRNAARSVLIAFQNNSNGGNFNFNSQNHEWVAFGNKVDIEISNKATVLWNGSFYLECHPNYAGETLADYKPSCFEFVEWDKWAIGKTFISFDSR